MDRARLQEARARLGLKTSAVGARGQIEAPIAPAEVPSSAPQPQPQAPDPIEPAQAQETPLAGFDVLTESMLTTLPEAKQPVVSQIPEASKPKHPLSVKSSGKNALPGVLTGTVGLALIGAGLAMGGRP